MRANDYRAHMRFCEGRMRNAINQCRGWRGNLNRLFGLWGDWRESVHTWHDLWRDWRNHLKEAR